MFRIDGPLPWYSVRYVPVVRLDGSGDPLTLRGSAFLEVVLRAATDDDGRPVLKTTRLRPDFPALREVDAPFSYEGQTVAGVGLSQRVGFRVTELADPSRIVLDVAHPAADGPADGPKALTVTPNRGPVGTRVTVEGQGCDPGSAIAQTAWPGWRWSRSSGAAYWNALRPVRAWPRMRLWTSLVPS